MKIWLPWISSSVYFVKSNEVKQKRITDKKDWDFDDEFRVTLQFLAKESPSAMKTTAFALGYGSFLGNSIHSLFLNWNILSSFLDVS